MDCWTKRTSCQTISPPASFRVSPRTPRTLQLLASLDGLRRRNGPNRLSSSMRSFLAASPMLRMGSLSSGVHKHRSHGVRARVSDEDVDLHGEAIAEDYYSVLGLKPDASQEEIKHAYYACMKVCHPDLSNNHPDSVSFCSFINEVYEVLSDPEMRAVYDEIKGYSVSASNPFFDTEAERDFAFVDEFTCIGCKNCANTAERTFGIEEMWGRARVYNQRGNCSSKVQEAIDTCPVECIHWVSAAQLALLEDEMRRVERVSVGIMMAGQGAKGIDVFRQASARWERRKRAAEAKARIKAMREMRRQAAQGARKGWEWEGAWWGVGGTATSSTGDEGMGSESEDEGTQKPRSRRRPSKEKMEKAAEAARRWREYSQKGVDRRRGLAIAESKVQLDLVDLPSRLMEVDPTTMDDESAMAEEGEMMFK